jgi:hypothetical protein
MLVWMLHPYKAAVAGCLIQGPKIENQEEFQAFATVVFSELIIRNPVKVINPFTISISNPNL